MLGTSETGTTLLSAEALWRDTSVAWVLRVSTSKVGVTE